MTTSSPTSPLLSPPALEASATKREMSWKVWKEMKANGGETRTGSALENSKLLASTPKSNGTTRACIDSFLASKTPKTPTRREKLLKKTDLLKQRGGAFSSPQTLNLYSTLQKKQHQVPTTAPQTSSACYATSRGFDVRTPKSSNSVSRKTLRNNKTLTPMSTGRIDRVRKSQEAMKLLDMIQPEKQSNRWGHQTPQHESSVDDDCYAEVESVDDIMIPFKTPTRNSKNKYSVVFSPLTNQQQTMNATEKLED